MPSTLITGADLVKAACVAAVSLIAFSGCPPKDVPQPDYDRGRPSRYVDVDSATGTTGISAKDIDQVADLIVRRMLENPEIANRSPPARIAIDVSGFKNESSSPFNMNMLAQRIRSRVGSRSQGRVKIVDINQKRLDKNRQAVQDGLVGQGTMAMPSVTTGVDYEFEGIITSHEDPTEDGYGVQRTFQFTMRLLRTLDNESIEIGDHMFAKSGTDDAMYR